MGVLPALRFLENLKGLLLLKDSSEKVGAAVNYLP
jgi:hypothetical protein